MATFASAAASCGGTAAVAAGSAIAPSSVWLANCVAAAWLSLAETSTARTEGGSGRGLNATLPGRIAAGSVAARGTGTATVSGVGSAANAERERRSAGMAMSMLMPMV